MNKKGIITAMMALACITAQAIDEYQFHRGTVVLKGRVLNKPAEEWTSILITTYNHFTDKDYMVSIPVKDDGNFEAAITLPHSQGVWIDDIGNVFLAVGDTLELTKDATKPYMEGVTFGGHGLSTNINRLWPEVKKHYFNDKTLNVIDLSTEEIPAWKQEMVKLMDAVIADIEAEKLPVPVATSSYEKEVLGASALAMPFLEVMRVYRNNMTTLKADEYYDFVADRERWLLGNPAMLFAIDSPSHVFSYMSLCLMLDVSWGADRFRVYYRPDDPADMKAYKYNFVLPSNFDANLHSKMLALRQDTLFTMADYFRTTTQATLKRFHLKQIDFMLQMALCRYIFDEVRLDDITADRMADNFAAVMPYFKHSAVARHALEAYRQFVISKEGKIKQTASLSPEGDSIFQHIIAPYKGYALYVDFWGMSCGPCRLNMMNEREKVEQMKEKPVRFLYICDETDRPREVAERWLTENNIKGEHIYVTHEEWKHLSTKFQFSAIPFSTAVDKDGNLTTQKELDNAYYFTK
ncbi:MAG: hypothetical protein IKY01_03415 [Prevotella sp.]|nr:hypothetical protein [Prevotella sp.]